MKFIKSLFSRDPKERIRTKILELEYGDKAIEIPEAIEEDNFRLVTEVSEKMIMEGELNGILIGKKGWFLPNGNKKLEDVWKELEVKGFIQLDKIAENWQINEKRVFIALTNFSEMKDLNSDVFHRDNLTVYFVPYLKDKWISTLAKYDLDEGIEFDKIMKNASISPEIRDKFREKVITWIQEKGATYALGEDRILRLRSSIRDLVKEYIPASFDDGVETLTYNDIANKYGITIKEVGIMLQDLVDEKLLGKVTLYPLDQMIKSRN